MYPPAPGDAGGSYYQNGFNPTSNYISVIDVWNSGGPYSSTDATWDLWRQVKGDPDRGNSQSFGDLQGIIQYTCSNDPAKAVAADIFRGEKGKDVVKVFHDGDLEYDALLGIPNGVFPSRLLTQNPGSMGSDRQLESIIAWIDDPTRSDIMGVLYLYS